MERKTFERNGEWAGLRVVESEKGFVVTFNSQIQGERDGFAVLVRFSDTFPQGMDLAAPWNDTMSNGDAIAQAARDHESGRIILHLGLLVQ